MNPKHSPQHWKTKALENYLFLLLIGAFLLNCLLILAVQAWFVYDLPAPVTADTILSMEPYFGAQVLDTAQGEKAQSWLLKTPDGETHMVTTEQHSFLKGSRILKKATGIVDSDDHQKNVGGDSIRVLFTVTDYETISSYSVNSQGIRIRGLGSIPLVFVLWNLLLLALEIAAGWLFTKLRA